MSNTGKPKPPFFKDPEFLRPQTLLLMLSIGLVLAMQFLPILTLETTTPSGESAEVVLQGRGLAAPLEAGTELSIPPSVLAGFLIVGIALPIAALWNYRDRKAALRYIHLSAAFLIISGVFIALFAFMFSADLENASYKVTEINMDLGLFALALALMLLIASGRAQKKDIKKVRNADRFWD